jgi:hypothetical protein
VFRGDSFRGLSYGTSIKYNTEGSEENAMHRGLEDKLPFYCTKDAVAIQRATAAAQLKLMVEPLEKQGLSVDIYLSGYGCTGLQHINHTWAKKLELELVQMYGGEKRVKAHHMFERNGKENQDTGVHQAMLLLLGSKPLDFESILLWRYDVVPESPMGPPTINPKTAGQAAITEASPWTNYGVKAGLFLFWFDDDWGYSFPGWYADCAISSLLHGCMIASATCAQALRLNMPLENDLAQQIMHGDGGGAFYIYRDAFSKHGERLCKILETFGGPKCAASREEAWARSCAAVKALNTARKPAEDTGLDMSDCFECKGVSPCKM